MRVLEEPMNEDNKVRLQGTQNLEPSSLVSLAGELSRTGKEDPPPEASKWGAAKVSLSSEVLGEVTGKCR